MAFFSFSFFTNHLEHYSILHVFGAGCDIYTQRKSPPEAFGSKCCALRSFLGSKWASWELDLASLVIIKLHNPVLLCWLWCKTHGKTHYSCACLLYSVLSSFIWAQSRHLCNRTSWGDTPYIYLLIPDRELTTDQSV